MKLVLLLVLVLCMVTTCVTAQEYVSPTKPAESGKAPGMKVKQVSANGDTKTYAIIFSKGDEVVSGLTEFAQKYEVQCAHYSAIGDAMSAKVGWYDYSRKQFKVIPINEAVEVTSLLGDVAVFNDKPVAHSHINVSSSDGTTRGGHLLELIVGPTLEVFVTVEPVGLYKKVNKEFEAGVIDPELNN